MKGKVALFAYPVIYYLGSSGAVKAQHFFLNVKVTFRPSLLRVLEKFGLQSLSFISDIPNFYLYQSLRHMPNTSLIHPGSVEVQ
jgi:hypothetical protein